MSRLVDDDSARTPLFVAGARPLRSRQGSRRSMNTQLLSDRRRFLIAPTRRFAQAATLSLLLALAAFSAAADPAFDIDTADAVTLAAVLPGVGPVKAKSIVAYREAHGPFGSIDRLIDVPGIGPVTLEKIRAVIMQRNASGQRSGSIRPESSDAGARVTLPDGGALPRSKTEQERAAINAVQAVKALALQDAERRGSRSLAR